MKISHGSLAMIGIVSLAGALAACGIAGSPPGSSGSPLPTARSSPSTPRASAFNSTDVAFARTMTVLQAQSEAMASLAARHTTNSQVRRYAALVRGQARTSERQIRGWLRGWHQAEPVPWSPGSAMPYRMGPGMMGFAGWSTYWGDMGRGWHAVSGVHGPAFDTAWTAMMARGYATEIAIAQRELSSGVSTRARGLAGMMIAWRRAGLSRLQRWYRAWGGPNWNRQGWWNRWSGWNWPTGWNQRQSGNNHSRWNGWNGSCGCW